MPRMMLGFALALTLGAGTLSAGPRSTGPSTIELVTPVAVSSTPTGDTVTIWPALGDYLMFRVTFPKSLDKYVPRIVVNCYQNGELVYGEAGPYYGTFMLGGSGSLWVYDQAPGDRQAGANCVATLFYFSSERGKQTWNYLAETQFDAAGAQQ